ncbi:hypothetical protein M1E08_04510 [Erwinia sp. PK3-005]
MKRPENGKKYDKEEERSNGKKSILNYSNFKRGRVNSIEICLVFFISYILSIFGMLDAILYSVVPGFASNLKEISPLLRALFVTLAVSAYTVIYGISPIQQVLIKILYPVKKDAASAPNSAEFFEDLYHAGRLKFVSEAPENKSSEEYLGGLISASELISKNIYSRGNLYLILGVMFAMAGLGFFYSQTHTIDINKSVINQAISLLPNFGVLFFLELVAFFFLKQYRVVMDEYRYYEAIKRSREESLAIIKFAKDSKNDIDIIELLDKIKFSSGVGRLESGQSTEIIEARKLDKTELEALTKMVEMVADKIGQRSK